MKSAFALLLCLAALPAMGASCYVTEYSDIIGVGVPVANVPITTQVVSYTTTAATASAFNANTRIIRVICDAVAHFAFGTTPTATANDPYVGADTVEYFGVDKGKGLKIAFYDGSSS